MFRMGLEGTGGTTEYEQKDLLRAATGSPGESIRGREEARAAQPKNESVRRHELYLRGAG